MTPRAFVPAAAGVALLALVPASAHADWFGIGQVVESVSDATWKIALVRAAERALPSLILLTCIVGSIGAVWVAGQLATRFGETARAAVHDGKVTGAEVAVLIAQAVITIAVVIALGWFGWFLMQASRSGLSELMR